MSYTNKKILHLNRGLSKIETNKNNTLTYTLDSPVRLEEGDQVTLYKAFLNERGLTASTMSFDQDTQFTLRFHYWVPWDIRKLGNFGTPETQTYQEFFTQPTNFSTFSTGKPNLEATFKLYEYTLNGPTGYPAILYEVSDGSDGKAIGTLKPSIGVKTIKIAAGNYTTDSLANLIEQQMSGQNNTGEANSFDDIYTFNTKNNGGFRMEFFDKQLVREATIYMTPEYVPGTDDPNLYFTQYTTQFGRPNVGHIFLPLNTHEYVKENLRAGNYTTIKNIEDLNTTRKAADNINILPWMYRKEVNIFDGDAWESAGYVGAKSFQFQYSADTQNRFSFTGLHTPLQLQSHSANNVTNPQAGSIITQFNLNLIGIDNKVSPGFYPTDASSGIAILSFDFDLVEKYSETYTSLDTLANQVEVEYLLYYTMHDDWFKTKNNGEAIWIENSIWNRFGFSYDQIGKITNQIQSYNVFEQGLFNMSGFITGNDYNFSQGLSISGLGNGIKTSDGTNFQAFSTVAGIPKIYEGVTNGYALANIETKPKFYNASSFPDLLEGKTYYVIHSDIVDINYLDPQALSSSVVGIASFEQATLDTIYSVEGIQFPVIQNKLLTTIGVRISYPDGSDIPDTILSASSGLVFIIEKPISVLQDTKPETSNKKNKK